MIARALARALQTLVLVAMAVVAAVVIVEVSCATRSASHWS
jgi:hypothetical protein